MVKHNAFIGKHKVSGRIVKFTQHINPKNTNDYFFRDELNPFNGPARDAVYLTETFDVISINLHKDS